MATQQEWETGRGSGVDSRAIARSFGNGCHPVDQASGEMLAPTDVEKQLMQGFESVRAAV